MVYRRIEKRTSIEKLKVVDSKFPDQPHYILLHITETFEQDVIDGKTMLAGDIELRADYFWGPLTSEVGELVSLMGGKSQSPTHVKISNGDVTIRIHALKGIGLGSYLFNRIVVWAKQFEPTRLIAPLHLTSGLDPDPQNTPRRNRLYEKFGIRLIFTDGIERGSSDPAMTIGEITPIPQKSLPHITTHTGFREFQNLAQHITDLERKVRFERSRRRILAKKLSQAARLKNLASHLVFWGCAGVVSVCLLWSNFLK